MSLKKGFRAFERVAKDFCGMENEEVTFSQQLVFDDLISPTAVAYFLYLLKMPE